MPSFITCNLKFDFSELEEVLNNLLDTVKEYSTFPKKAIWKTDQFDIPVTVTSFAGTHEGKKFYKIEGSKTSLPEDELIFNETST